MLCSQEWSVKSEEEGRGSTIDDGCWRRWYLQRRWRWFWPSTLSPRNSSPIFFFFYLLFLFLLLMIITFVRTSSPAKNTLFTWSMLHPKCSTLLYPLRLIHFTRRNNTKRTKLTSTLPSLVSLKHSSLRSLTIPMTKLPYASLTL